MDQRIADMRRLTQLMLNCEAMLSFERAASIVTHALAMKHADGEFVELGCHVGHTAALITAVTGRRMHVYDSFDGLPEPTEKDAGRAPHFQRGSLKCHLEDVLNTFKSAGLEHLSPVIHQGWIGPETQMAFDVAFAHIDTDFYSGTLASLALVHPRLIDGGRILVDDFDWDLLPGVSAACRDYFHGVPVVWNYGVPQQGLFISQP